MPIYDYAKSFFGLWDGWQGLFWNEPRQTLIFWHYRFSYLLSKAFLILSKYSSTDMLSCRLVNTGETGLVLMYAATGSLATVSGLLFSYSFIAIIAILAITTAKIHILHCDSALFWNFLHVQCRKNYFYAPLKGDAQSGSPARSDADTNYAGLRPPHALRVIARNEAIQMTSLPSNKASH